MPPLELTGDEVAEVLSHGDLEVVGRLRYSSNNALLVTARADGVEVPAVYKPQRGERPLWDFPDGTLSHREVAAYEVSHALGWEVVPVTVKRVDGPVGEGALQRFVEHDPEEHYFTLLADHEDRFRQFAAFDVLVNNADRKGGHCLHDLANDVILGIDHGLTFHRVWKLRTVVWDFGGEAVPAPLLDDVCRVSVEALEGPLAERLVGLLDPPEMAALAVRGEELARLGRFPEPDAGYHSVPWPLV
ncbi:MAG TPA: SCO1664 family protein [Acidimicrobiia bacterium]|nr:SCO1664 family protein [Acidimicrobiia bacterium]